MKVTALFTARRGRSFLAALSTREGRNYQFDFLRPTHSLFGYFNRLVEQYSKVLLPTKETHTSLKERSQEGARWMDLEVARRRARWEQFKREKDKRRQDDKEAEASAWPLLSGRTHIDHGFQLLSPRLIGTTMLLYKPSNSLQPMRTPSSHRP